jgi:hypothetical protein
MKNFQSFLASTLVLALLAAPVFSVAPESNPALNNSNAPQQQSSTNALERGYRTGYSDGYPTGMADASEQAARDYRNKEDYRRGDRAFVSTYGSLDDYRGGYQQGFEAGYNAGFDRRTFDSTVPASLARRTDADDNSSSNNNNVRSNDDDQANSSSSSSSSRSTGNSGNSSSSVVIPAGAGGGTVIIPQDTNMTIELLTSLSTDSSQRGDRFQARVTEPREFEGATLEGRVTRVKRPGKVKGTAELQLSFDQIRMPDNRSSSINAQVIEVISPRSDGVGNVDPEGGVKGRDNTKDDVAKISAGTGIGAIIGAIAGGGKGAAIGAAIGGAASTTGVISSRGKELRLERGEQLRIRTSNETRIQ